MALILEAKDADDWVYRGEGAANLVLSYKGSSPAFVGKVMRIQKADNKSLSRNGPSPEEWVVWNKALDLESRPTMEVVQQLYIQHIMQPLLRKPVDAGVHILVSRDFLELIEKNVHHERPSCRIDAAKAEILCDSVVLISDHCIFPSVTVKEQLCFSIEIKPKCGFLPISTYISEENTVKKNISRFKMHQELKFHKNEVTELSEYNPLDMFSGTAHRIENAIRALFRTPQNNLRFFVNGHRVNSIGTAEFEDVLKRIIKKDDGNTLIPYFSHVVTEGLYRSGLLDNLLQTQKLDTIDIEGAIHAYYDVISEPCVVCSKAVQTEKFGELHSLSLDEKMNIVRDYLISATAKDLSVMVTFTPDEDGKIVESSLDKDGKNVESSLDKDGELVEFSPDNNSFCLAVPNQRFHFKTSFIDLDMKPLKKMEYYYELDQKIVTWYKKTMIKNT